MTGFSKRGGPLSKRIVFDEHGKLTINGDACRMEEGTAQRFRPTDIEKLAEVIACMQPHHALALGALRQDLPDMVEIATKRRVDLLRARGQLNGEIARIRENILYMPETPAMALLDFDTKGMPDTVKSRLNALGHLAAGAAWSHNEEERRKSLLGYLMNGAPYIIWDNIKRGSQISCEFVEKICTMPEYVDRVLGQTQNVRVSTIPHTVHASFGAREFRITNMSNAVGCGEWRPSPHRLCLFRRRVDRRV
jgi:hypothetical protein